MLAEHPGSATRFGGWPVGVWLAAAAQALVLTLGSGGYGYHRDELYYRMLPARWSYVDQPGLAPLIARLTTHLADSTWALRIPATLACACSVLLAAAITRRLGGGRGAQLLCAWGYAFAAMPLMLGHVLLTSTLDLPLVLGVVLLVIIAVDGRPRTWVAAGALAGFTANNRLLVVAVVAALVLGLVVFGPRRSARTPWPWCGALVALAVALPQVVFQVTQHWPQLQMGRALSARNGGQVRGHLAWLLVVMLGPPLTVVWAWGVGWLLRAGQRRRFGFLAVAFVAMLCFSFAAGAQPSYPVHLMTVMYAAGCVPVARWLGERVRARRVALVLVAANALVSLVLALPAVPVRVLGRTPVPAISQLVADQVGWPRYVDQIAAAYRRVSASGPVDVIASNYGEAGAIARYGAPLGLPRAFSGHNALAAQGTPTASRVLVVGGQLASVRGLFGQCSVLASLDDGMGVDNEEQGQPIALCTEPVASWQVLWPRFAHLN